MKLDRVLAVRTGKTIYRSDEHVVKLFNLDYSKVDVLNEALNHSRVEETNLLIPKIEQVGIIEGKWALTTEYISGKTLERLLLENPDKEDEYLQLFVDLQMKVLSTPCSMLNKLKDKMKGKIEQTDLAEDVKYELQTRLESMPKHLCLCHGDFNLSNIIINENGEAYILDWSHVTLGNASADVARSYLLFHLMGRANMAEKYVALYCRQAKKEKAYIQKWIPIVAASRLVKGNADEKEFLTNWVNVVDYQ